MANNSAQYDVRLAFSADVAQARQQLKSLQDELSKLSTLKDVSVGTRLTKELEQASLKAADLKVMLEKATDINTGKLNLTSFSNQLTKNGESLSTYRKALSALGPQGEEAFLQLTQSVITADAALTTGSKKLNEFKKTLANTVKWQISSNITHGIVGELQTAYYYAKDLDRALTDIKIVTEDSAGSMADFAQKANKAAQSLSTTTKDYAQASLIYYQQGLSDKEVEARTAVTIKMANAAGESASKVSDQLTAVWNNFYDGSKSLEYYADVMTKLGAYTASSTDEISEGIQKFASVANTIGLSYEYATSALATLTAKTRESANVVGNSLKTLFARIQGLSLGETLEDGTDLNKYSTALAKAGIDIKDQNGELRDMNSILDEMMNKWDGMSRAQQVALAQTVAGVRQYTQLINLMENKDYFKELVGVAENSEGTLQIQADIFADSWEGARKRVQAAAEGIYDSLIDEEFFKDVDNVVTVVLNGINATIKGLGGVKGVVSNISALILNIYKKDITSGLNNFGTMLKNLTPQGQASIEARRQEALEQQKKLYTGGITPSELNSWETASYQDDARYEKYTKLAEVEQQILNISKDLTEEEKKQAGLYLDILNAASDRKVLTSQQVDQAKEQYQTIASSLIHSLRLAGAGDRDVTEVIRKNNNYLNAASIAYSSNTISKVDEKSPFDTVLQSSKIKDIENLQKMINDLQNFNDFDFARFNEDAFIGIKTSLDELITKLKNGTATAKEFNKVLEDTGKFTMTAAFGQREQIDPKTGNITQSAIPGARQEVQEQMEIATVYTEATGPAQQLAQATQGLNVAMERQIKTSNEVKASEEGTTEAVKKLGNSTVEASDKIVAFSTSAMNIAGIFNSLQGVVNIWSNDNLSGWEKILGTLTSLGILLPNLVSLGKAMTIITQKITVAKTQEAAAHTLNGNAIQAEGEQAKLANKNFSILGKSMSGISAAAGWISIALTALTLIISAVSAAIEEAKEKRAEFAQTTKETYEQTKQEIEENEKLVTSYQELLETYKKTGEGKTDLVNTSIELIDVFDIENGSLLLLQGNYEELTKRILEAKQAKDTLAIGEAKAAYFAANDTVKDELGSTFGSYWDIASENAGDNQGSRLQIAHIAGSDYDIMQQYLNSVEGSSNWTVKNFQGNGAFDIANVIDFYDNANTNMQQFSEWAQKETSNGGLGWSEEQVNEYLEESRTSLASMKTLVDGWKDIQNDTNLAILNASMNEYDETKVKDLPSYLKQREVFTNQKDDLEVGYTSNPDEIITSFLGTNSKTSDYETLLNGLQSWYDQYSSFLPNFEEIINSGLTDEELKVLVNIDPRITGGSLEDLQNQIQKYLKTHPVDISADIKAGKKALKEDMSGKNDWKDFWEATSNITWGKNGIVSQADFQGMQYGQQQKYLNELYSQNAQTFSPEERIARATEENAELEQQINNLKGLSDEQVTELQRGNLTEKQNQAYDDFSNYETQINNLLEAYKNSDNYGKYNDSSWYEDMLFSNTAFNNPGMYDNWINTLIARIGGTPENFIKPEVTTENSLIEGRDTKRNLENQRQGFQEDNITQLEKEQAENTRELQNALIDYNTEISRTIQNLANTDLKIGDIIQPEQVEALKAIGINLDDYFIPMEDGTYKLITAAEEFNRIVGKASIQNAYNGADIIIQNLQDSGHFLKTNGLSDKEIREQARVQAEDIIDNQGQTNWSEERKQAYLDAAKVDSTQFDSIDEAMVEAAQRLKKEIENGDYIIDVTIKNANSMSELENLAKEAGWNKTDKEYTDAILNYQAENGNSLGRDEAIAVQRDSQNKQAADEALAEAQKQENKAREAVYNATGNDSRGIPNRVLAEEELEKAINKRVEAETKVKEADDKLANSTETLSKKMKKVDFTETVKNLKEYADKLKSAGKGTEEYEQSLNGMAEELQNAFGGNFDAEIVKKHQNLINKLINGTAQARRDAAAQLSIIGQDSKFKTNMEQAFEGAEEEVQTKVNEITSAFSTMTNGLSFNVDGSITMDSQQAIAQVGALIGQMDNLEAAATLGGSFLRALLDSNIEFDASSMEKLENMLIVFAKVQNGENVDVSEVKNAFKDLGDIGLFASGKAIDVPPYNMANKSGGGGSKSKKSAADIGKEIQDEKLKTYEKKRELLEAKRDGANPEDAAKYIQEEIDLLKEEQDILEDQIKSWKELLKVKVQEFNKEHPEFEIKLTDDGEIANASELWGQVWAQYQKNLEDGMSEEELNEWFTKIKDALDGPMGIQQNIDENVALIAQKEKEQAELELESITKAIDWKVKQIDFQIKRLNYYQEKLLKQAHGNKQTIEAMLEGFAYQEQEMLQLFDKGATLRDGIDQLVAAKAKYPGYEQMFDEQILEYQSDLIDVNEAILDLRNDIEDLVQNVLDLALDEIDKQIERLDTYTSMLDHLNNIIDLSGRSMLDMGLKTQIGATKVETMLGKMKALKAQMDGLTKATKEAEAALADRQADGDTSSVKFWENQVEVLKQETEKASEEFLASWEETLEAAQDLFEMRVEMAVAVLSNALSPFETLEDFQDKYEKAKTINEEYLDDAERLYELNKLNRQLNLQLADANDLLAKQKLRDLQQEIHDLQADGVQMSQYDLEYLQKKYDLQLAEIALMEQQNSKTSMRLVRDAAGNWTYAYDADEEKIEDATQKYEDAVHELDQLSKDYINDVSEQLIQNQIDFKEALQDLDKNSADYSNQLLSLQEYYVERQRYLLDELNKGVVNSGQTFHDTLYGQMTDLYDYNDAYMLFVNNSNATITELQTNYKDWQKVVETAMSVAGTSWDNFGTDMGGTLDSLEEHIQKLCDEIEELVNVLMGYISQSIGMVLDWEQKYSKRTDQELAANESYIDGNFIGSSSGGGSSNVDMQTDFTALIQRWMAGERDLTNWDNSKTYNSLEEIKADLGKKLDAFENGEEILFQGSGESFDEDAYQTVYDHFYKGYGTNGGRYGSLSYPNTFSNSIVDKAANYLGTKYTYGGKDASTGLDCSGLVYKALNDAGVNVPILTAEGYKQMAKSISSANIKPGDLVFFGANGVADHVGIYMGNGQMINATGTKTQITSIDSKKAGLIGYGRIGNSYSSSDTAALMDRLGLSRRGGAASGAYTGDWGPGQGIGIDNGKIIKVHPKELILNKSDTRNILRAVDIVRNMNDWVDKQVQQLSNLSSSKLDSLYNSAIPRYDTQPIKQEVTIQADFPGVTDHYEIEEALSNLSNNAAQYISANKSK